MVTVGGALAVGSATSDNPFGPYNYQWDGTSDLRDLATDEGTDAVFLRESETYEEYGKDDIAFVIGPDNFSEDSTGHVSDFVERGGTLVVAYRDEPVGENLLSAVGAEARPDGAMLRDELNHHRSPRLPIATEVGDHELVADVESVVLNHGTAVEANGATVLIESSPFSYLDRDGSGEPTDEPVESYPVATVESVGNGQVIVVGDPSIFINVMQEQNGNAVFTRGLVEGADHMIVDASTEDSIPILVHAVMNIRENVLLQLGLGVGALLIVGLSTNMVVRLRNRSRATQ